MVKLEENKSYSENCLIEKLPLPKKVYIPLAQHIGKPNSPTVKIGDQVGVGQKIASTEAAISSPIHASISGKVSAIANWPHPSVGMFKAIVIDSDNRDKLFYSRGILSNQIEKLTADESKNMVNG